MYHAYIVADQQLKPEKTVSTFVQWFSKARRYKTKAFGLGLQSQNLTSLLL